MIFDLDTNDDINKILIETIIVIGAGLFSSTLLLLFYFFACDSPSQDNGLPNGLTNGLTCGLTYTQKVVDSDCEMMLVAWLKLKQHQWETAPGERKVLQFGYRYFYDTKTIGISNKPIPFILNEVIDTLMNQKLLSARPNQIIINKYSAGQGISPHTDSYFFGEEISSLSLQSSVHMDFTLNKKIWSQKLEPRSLLHLTGPMRWFATHAIAASQTIEPRTSITFRTVIPNNLPSLQLDLSEGNVSEEETKSMITKKTR